MRGLAAAVAAIALCSSATVTGAQPEQKRVTVRGVQSTSGSIWYSQTVGRPVISFPFGCNPSKCQYSIWIEYIPRNKEPIYNVTEPLVEVMDRCAAWVVFHDPILPLRGSFGLHFQDGVMLDEALIHATGRTALDGHELHASSGFGPQVFGNSYQYLLISSWWLEIDGKNCQFGYRACYHPERRKYDAQGLRCPLDE